MWEQIKLHTAWLQGLEESADVKFQELLPQIIETRKYFQHERLVHLLVTIGLAVVMIMVLSLFSDEKETIYGILFVIMALLEMAYIVHYYRLETGVQGIWKIEKRLYERARNESEPNR